MFRWSENEKSRLVLSRVLYTSHGNLDFTVLARGELFKYSSVYVDKS